ncbi:MAG: hypothetical protein ACSHX0_10245 [Akkermansiaceae bacterium]
MTAKNFIKYYDSKLLRELDTGTEIFDDWLLAMHSKYISGQKPLLDQLVDSNGTLNRLEIFLKPPNEFSPWKAGFETADDWGNTARGRLLQLDEAYHGNFKTWGNLDTISDTGVVNHSKALGFQSLTDAGVYAEMKTTSARCWHRSVSQLASC